MHVELQKGLIRPSTFPDVTCVKVYSREGNIVAILVENGPLISVTCAGDADFKTYSEQFGINARRLRAFQSIGDDA